MHRPLRTLLIVDDSPEDRELYRRYLLRDQDYAYTILEATLGQEGLELWQQCQPDAVLLDYRLPDFDGLDVLTRLQTLRQQACLPVIMVTGQGNEAIAVQAMKAGAQDYLIKEQITPEGLHLAVNEVIEKERLRTELQQRIERERLIAQITQQIHRSLDLKTILQTTVDGVRQFLHTDRVIIFQLASDGLGTVVTESVSAPWSKILDSQIYDPCFTETYVERYRQGLVTAKSNIEDGSLDECHVNLLTQLQVKANLVVPIAQDERLWGMIIAHHCRETRLWQPLEIDLLKQLADQIGIALHQAELYQQAQNELTERRRTEAALRDSEARFRQLTENIDAVFWVVEVPDRRVSYVSPAYQCLWGLDPQALYADRQTWINRVHPDDQDATEQAFQTQASTGKFDVEYRIVLPDGRLRWVRDRCFPLLDELGQVYRFTGIAEDITDRKYAELQLQESQHFIQQIAETTPGVLYVYDLIEQRNIYVNQQITTLLGYTVEQVGNMGENLLSTLIHPADFAHLPAHIAQFQTANDTDVFELEYRMRHANGEWRWFHDRSVLFSRTADGMPQSVLGISQDISDRKQVEASLVMQQQRYHYIFESVGVSIWEEDFAAVKTAIDQLKAAGVQDFRQYFKDHPDFVQQAVNLVRLQNVNQTSLQLFGAQSKAELLGSLSRIFTPETLDIFGEELLAIAAEVPYFTAETVLQTLQGDRFHAWFAITFPPAAESYDRVLVTLLDISDRKQVEQALRRSEEELRIANERFELAAAAVNCLIYDWDRECNRVERTEGLTRILGYSLAETDATAEWWNDRIHPDDLQALLAIAPDRLRTSDYHTYEYRVRHKDGHYIYVLDQAIVVARNTKGEAIRIVGSTSDITDRKQADIEREQLLQRERAAKEAAEQANRIKDEFLAVLSHELRSPLNPILGWSKLLQTQRLDPAKTVEALASIERNARLQTQLIDDLLDIAKILRGKLNMQVTTVDLVFVIEAALETVKTAALAKAIDLQCQIRPPQLPDPALSGTTRQHPKFQVSGDAARLQQIIWNLLSNAIKFTPAGGQVNVYLELVGGAWDNASPLSRAASLPSVQITVSDTGKGINPDFLPHIFESFRQEDASTTRHYGGLGLGLAIVRSLVEAHGGTIMADSPGEGSGATFTVRLPLLKLATVAQQSAPSPDTDKLALTGIRVLTVDDEADSRELCTVSLTQFGAEVLTVDSAAAVLASLESFQPHVLVSDIGMPGMDGYALLQQIRSLPTDKGGQVPAIALTAYAREDDEQKTLSKGFQRHLAKPVTPLELVQTIRSLVAPVNSGAAT